MEVDWTTVCLSFSKRFNRISLLLVERFGNSVNNICPCFVHAGAIVVYKLKEASFTSQLNPGRGFPPHSSQMMLIGPVIFGSAEKSFR